MRWQIDNNVGCIDNNQLTPPSITKRKRSVAKKERSLRGGKKTRLTHCNCTQRKGEKLYQRINDTNTVLEIK